MPRVRNNLAIHKLAFRNSSWQCQYCGEITLCKCCNPEIPLHSFTLATLDHITPKAKGGTDGLYNLALCCNLCNQLKSNLQIEARPITQDLIIETHRLMNGGVIPHHIRTMVGKKRKAMVTA
jgi:5-methylcytosine-specific restriction endonuclease McrA